MNRDITVSMSLDEYRKMERDVKHYQRLMRSFTRIRDAQTGELFYDIWIDDLIKDATEESEKHLYKASPPVVTKVRIITKNREVITVRN